MFLAQGGWGVIRDMKVLETHTWPCQFFGGRKVGFSMQRMVVKWQKWSKEARSMKKQPRKSCITTNFGCCRLLLAVLGHLLPFLATFRQFLTTFVFNFGCFLLLLNAFDCSFLLLSIFSHFIFFWPFCFALAAFGHFLPPLAASGCS